MEETKPMNKEEISQLLKIIERVFNGLEKIRKEREKNWTDILTTKTK